MTHGPRGIAERKLRASSWAAATGTIISALISSRPTIRIATTTVDGGQHREQRC